MKVIGQQPGDMSPLVEHLALNGVALNEIKRFAAPRKGWSSEALLVLGEKSETTQTIRLTPTGVEYWVATTYPRERAYRSWFLDAQRGMPLLDRYKALAKRFPNGLADIETQAEEANGAVQQAVTKRRRVAKAAAGAI